MSLLYTQRKIKQYAGWFTVEIKAELRNLVTGYTCIFIIQQTPEASGRSGNKMSAFLVGKTFQLN
ncbi:MAG: hypothetical protein K2Q24_14090 [Chitinophagaceae bacterium]|nr:hypothetical protein [Chitinophagaceae bacterium]